MPDEPSAPAPVLKAPVKGSFGGLFLAAFAGPAMLMAGAIFCLAGLRPFAGCR
jgi:hypothetical protein